MIFFILILILYIYDISDARRTFFLFIQRFYLYIYDISDVRKTITGKGIIGIDYIQIVFIRFDAWLVINYFWNIFDWIVVRSRNDVWGYNWRRFVSFWKQKNRQKALPVCFWNLLIYLSLSSSPFRKRFFRSYFPRRSSAIVLSHNLAPSRYDALPIMCDPTGEVINTKIMSSIERA